MSLPCKTREIGLKIAKATKVSLPCKTTEIGAKEILIKKRKETSDRAKKRKKRQETGTDF
jgi:hypothetical protein